MTFGDFNIWGGDEVDVVLAYRASEVIGDTVAKCLLARGGDADTSLEHLAGCFAGAKARHAHLTCDLLERGINVVIKLGLVYRDRQLDLVSL